MGRLIDCDVHIDVPGLPTLFPYLPRHWVEQIENTVFKGPSDTAYPPSAAVSASPVDLSSLRDHMDRCGAEIAMMNCLYAIDGLHNPDQAVALARAANDWQIAEWLDRDPRLRASIVVPSQIPALAAQEIERVADHSGFVQVLLPARSHHPYGNRLFHPLWEALAAHDLVAGIHFGGAPGNPPTAVGWPSYYLEEHAGMSLVFAAQVTSLVVEGVFDLFPTLRVTLLESGVSWMAAHMWRFDKEWKNLRRQVPWVKRPPSDYIREHMRLTTAPLDAPPDFFQDIVKQLGSDPAVLLPASGYPLPYQAPELREGYDDARGWYRL